MPPPVARSVKVAQPADHGVTMGEARAAKEPSPSAPTQIASAAPAANIPAANIVDALDAPRARFAPPPDYPDEARWEEREGRVVLHFRLRADGEVSDVEVVNSSGHADLDAEALATLSRWKFDASGTGASETRYRHAFRFSLR